MPPPVPRLLLAACVALGGVLAGCGAAPPPPALAPAPPPATASPVVGPVEPTGLRIPALGLASGALMGLGLDARGFVRVPPVEQPERIAWYRAGVIPGDPGPAVILAHVNGAGRPGAFHRLVDLRAGDVVEVDRSDGRTSVFRVTRMQTVPKDVFPTAEVYGDTPGPELRLITCGGGYDPAARSYTDQVIAYAKETST